MVMASEAPRSPSPVSAPPVGAAPGPRAATLMKLYEEAISHTLNSCNYQNFAACFPTTGRNVPEALEALHKDFVNHLGDRFRKEFDITLQRRNVITALNDLDRLVEEARRRKARAESEASEGAVQPPIPAHTLPAKSLYLTHLNPDLSSRQNALSLQLETIQRQNAELADVITRQRAEINEHVSTVEKVVGDLNDSLALLPPNEAQVLTKETVELDVEMRSGD